MNRDVVNLANLSDWTPIAISRENKLEDFCTTLQRFTEFIPPIDDDDPLAGRYPQLCYIGQACESGKEYAVWITFKSDLSVRAISIYFDQVTEVYIIQLLLIISTYYMDIVKRVTFSKLETGGMNTIYNFNTTNH